MRHSEVPSCLRKSFVIFIIKILTRQNPKVWWPFSSFYLNSELMECFFHFRWRATWRTISTSRRRERRSLTSLRQCLSGRNCSRDPWARGRRICSENWFSIWPWCVGFCHRTVSSRSRCSTTTASKHTDTFWTASRGHSCRNRFTGEIDILKSVMYNTVFDNSMPFFLLSLHSWFGLFNIARH